MGGSINGGTPKSSILNHVRFGFSRKKNKASSAPGSTLRRDACRPVWLSQVGAGRTARGETQAF